MRPPYFYTSQDISGVFIRNEYVQALKDIVAFCKGETFAPDVDNSEGSNGEAEMASDVGSDGDTVMETAQSNAASTPFPSTIANPFAGTEFPAERRKSGVVLTGSPGIGEYDHLGCVGYLTHSIQANLCYWMSSYTCAIWPGVTLFLFKTRIMQMSSTPPASPECRSIKSLNPDRCHPFGCSSTQTGS